MIVAESVSGPLVTPFTMDTVPPGVVLMATGGPTVSGSLPNGLVTPGLLVSPL